MDKSGRQETAETQSGNDGCSGGRWRWWTATTADNNNSNGGRQQRWTTKAADDEGTQDRTADYKGEGGERAANNNGRLISLPGREREKIKKFSLRKKTFFSNTVCPVGCFAPTKTANVPF